jgi:hypothetical protein
MNENRVTVTDIDIPFGRLVNLILKLMLAAIPAVLLFYAVIFCFALIFGLGLGGCASILAP